MKDESILVVEDDDQVSQLLTDLLERRGYQDIQVAVDGHKGIEKYKESRPNIVLMDLEMPVMDGYHSSREIKEYDPGANIVLITADPMSPYVQKALEEGYACQVVAKPFLIDDLFGAIEESLGSPLHPR